MGAAPNYRLRRRTIRIRFGLVRGTIAASLLVVIATADSTNVNSDSMNAEKRSATELAQRLLRAVRSNSPYDELMNQLCAFRADALVAQLDSDVKKRAFWLNIYNSLGQVSLQRTTVDLTDSSARNEHYARRDLCIAGNTLSLNDIEHGMLRHSKIWWSAGYLSKWFPSAFEKSLRVPLDPRIHFALNCGAASCPPILFYDAAALDKQLDQATRVYLTPEVTLDKTTNTLRVSKLFQWYAGDFGGSSGVIAFLKLHEIIPADAQPRIVYNQYNWAMQLDNFAED